MIYYIIILINFAYEEIIEKKNLDFIKIILSKNGKRRVR
jgi:hypothetical protein